MRGLISIIRRANKENRSSLFSRHCRKRKFDVIVFVRSTDVVAYFKKPSYAQQMFRPLLVNPPLCLAVRSWRPGISSPETDTTFMSELVFN